ncbi:succinate dehydrogenase [Escherichia coli]|nr:succinate dehydrogenase [Escherichia coli]
MRLSKRHIFFHLKFYVFVLTEVHPVRLRNKYIINTYVVMMYFYKLFPA